ncbi:hypothetical protein LCGC14_1379490 [marine sediment metagenome]|uniref:Methyltransferase type 11 domain-containing protein n=1 Tax=marine sediment metagenome TaxID=412755 RepID=A0A0F9K372_9ZZZZ
MSITATDKFERLGKFMKALKNDVYPEPFGNESFIESGFDSIKDKIKPGQKILDIGCGHGYAMDLFAKAGASPIGITLDGGDKSKAVSMGHDVRIMDMSFLEFEDNYFDGLWARQSLEHSIFPYYTLSEFYRVLKPGGWIYVEVPAPGTDAKHENNGNHYSIMPLLMWGNLMTRTGFMNLKPHNITFELIDPWKGDELYFRITGMKPGQQFGFTMDTFKRR